MTLSEASSPASGDTFSVQFVVTAAFVTGAGNTGNITGITDLGTLTEATNATSSTAFTYQVGPGTTANDTITVTLNQITDIGLGVNGTSVTGATNTNANTASTAIDAAVNTLNTARANVGGAQSRLGFASANLSTNMENADAARSSLLDLDIAAEMTTFTSKQILEQTGISMLAQADRMPQNLLKLFQ
jgi:flagellin